MERIGNLAARIAQRRRHVSCSHLRKLAEHDWVKVSMLRFFFYARPAVFLVLTCCLAWSTALADPPAVYLAEGNAIDPPPARDRP